MSLLAFHCLPSFKRLKIEYSQVQLDCLHYFFSWARIHVAASNFGFRWVNGSWSSMASAAVGGVLFRFSKELTTLARGQSEARRGEAAGNGWGSSPEKRVNASCCLLEFFWFMYRK